MWQEAIRKRAAGCQWVIRQSTSKRRNGTGDGSHPVSQPTSVPRAPRTGSGRPDWPIAVVFSVGGLGLAIARRLGQRQRLLLVDRDAAALELAAARLADEGHDVVTAVGDVTDPGDVAQVAR